MTNEETPTTPEEETLFPAKIVEMTGGMLVTIRPWGMTTGRLLAPRVGELVKSMNADYGVKSIAKLVRESTDEVYEIVRMTLGWTPKQMDDDILYEDLFTLAQAVINVCIFRGEDTGGVMGKALALAVLRETVETSAEIPSPNSESKDAT